MLINNSFESQLPHSLKPHDDLPHFDPSALHGLAVKNNDDTIVVISALDWPAETAAETRSSAERDPCLASKRALEVLAIAI
jgi:hypothetical protein